MQGKRLEGKVAFITGAARGQGRSHALRLAEEGADIIAIDICGEIAGMQYPAASESDLMETVDQVQALNRHIVATKADVRDFYAVKDALDQGVANFGRLDIVSANAGITSVARPTHLLSESDWKDMLDVNLTGVWHSAKAAIPHMIKGGRGGAIIITSSIAGLKAYKNLGHYVAAKHGVVGLMRTLARELAPHGIRVNSVHPTQVETPMIMNDATFRLFVNEDEPNRETFMAASRTFHALAVPWIEPIDVSNALLFLASDEARYVTGATLPIDAGALLE